MEEIPGPNEQGHTRSLEPLRIVLADPPAFTPAYDHELAAALARAGADVELVTSHFRFGEAPSPDGYVRRELFYPVSSKLFRPLAAARAAEGRRASARAGGAPLPPGGRPARAVARAGDRRAALPAARARVFTAHDLLPRRTAKQQSSGGRSSRASTASSCTASTAGRRSRRSASTPGSSPTPCSPAIPSGGRRAHSALLGVIRAYKGLGDAIEARAGGRARSSSRATRWSRRAVPRRRGDVEWRLGYLPQAEIDRALGEATVGDLPVPARARPERRAAPRARGRRPRGRLRRRRHRRADAPFRRRPRRAARRRRRARRRGRRAARGSGALEGPRRRAARA